MSCGTDLRRRLPHPVPGARHPPMPLACGSAGSETQVKLMAKALGVRPEAFADCRWRTFQEVIHLLFQLEGDEGIVPAPGESAIKAGKPYSTIELALIDWGEKRAELDAGEITREEYEDWKDSYSPGKEGSVD